MEYGIVSLIVPLLAIILAIITKDVVVSLFGGIFLGFLVLTDYSFFEAFRMLLEGIVGIFSEGWMTKTILFVMLVGSIIAILKRAGAIDSFVDYLSQKSQSIDSPKGAMFLAYIIGIIIFIESSITVLVAGVVSQPLCDKNGVSREKLAYICDSTSAPVCSLIPLNGWGALLLGLIATAINSNIIQGTEIDLLMRSIPYNFYAIITVIMVFFVIKKDINLKPMGEYKAREFIANDQAKTKANLYDMLLPIGVLVLLVPVGLYITGKGDIFQGSGSTSVYYAVVISLLFMYLFFVPRKKLSHKGYFEAFYKGLSDMLPLGIIMILAFLIGKVIGDLDTAGYLSSLVSESIPPILIPMLIFLISAITAFATGTSWGTFSVMMPISLAMGANMGLDIPLMIGAVISGGVFGDHASPISDTTIISATATGCEPIDHVRTQLPYALIAGALAAVAFLVAGGLSR